GWLSIATKYHKIPLLFRRDDLPAEVYPGGSERMVRHPIHDNARTFVHVGDAEWRAAGELGLVREQIGASGENHFSARFGVGDRIVGHTAVLGEAADPDECDVGAYAVDAGRRAGAECRLVIIVDL